MRVVIQRVRYARLSVGGELISQISQGLMVLVGIAEEDGREEINYLCKKLAALRVFDDDEGVMNRSVVDVGGEVMLVSQFTLMANTKKGNRPSYICCAPRDKSPFVRGVLLRFGGGARQRSGTRTLWG